MIQPGGLPDYKVPAQYNLPNRMLQISEELTGEQNPEDLVDYTDFQHSELACPVTESLQPASRIDCFTQTDPTPPCCHHQYTDDSAAQPADPQPADPQPQPAAPQPRQPRSRVVRSRKSSFTDYLPLIRKYEAVLQKQKDDPHSTLTDLCSGIVSYNSFKEIRPIAELYIADPGTFREIYSRLKHGPVKSLKLSVCHTYQKIYFRFIDLLQHLSTSLDSLTKNLVNSGLDSLKYTKEYIDTSLDSLKKNLVNSGLDSLK